MTKKRSGSRRLRAQRVLAAVAACCLVAAGCGNATSPSAVPAKHAVLVSGGTATFAESPGTPPSYIFPLDALQYFSISNIEQFQNLMWRPLYWFGKGSDVELNAGLSLAEPPVYSQGNRVVTIRLKSFRWSDGAAVTSRDVTFWINLLRANEADWGEYAPGYFPDDVKSVTAEGDRTVVLRLTGPVNPAWFSFNELSQITPLPQHAWDRTSAGGPVSDYDRTPAKAKAVYRYLDGQSKILSTYATNPLWQVVDGPWKLSKFSADGYAAFVPNGAYSGDKPRLAQFVEEPFSSDTAEYNDLRSGKLTYGYVPLSDISQKALLQSEGYSTDPWYLWSMNIIPMNFNNPTEGPLFRQLYVRQAMQRLINEPQLRSAILNGYGITDNGPVPNGPSTQFVDQTVKAAPLAYSPAKASALLAAHGWKKGSDGVAECAAPGDGAADCGPGVKAGQRLELSLLYASGLSSVNQEMQALKSSLSQAGIDLRLTSEPTSDIFATAVPCTSTQTSCKWGMAYWGNGWEFAPDNYPTGEVAFSSGAVGNYGSYSNTRMDSLVKATTTEPGAAPLDVWQDYTAEQLPMLFMPVSPYQVSAISSKLVGAIPEPTDGLAITPELWSLSR